MSTKVPDDLSKLSDEKLNELWEKTAAEALEVTTANKRVAKEVNKRNADRVARDKLAAMTSAERRALLQIMEAEGIESEENFQAAETANRTEGEG